MSFVLTDKEVGATIEKMERGKLVQSILFVNELQHVKHFNTIFEELWENGIDAKHRTCSSLHFWHLSIESSFIVDG
jgi:hypothetical protein